jgi:non-reducing end alpha-L-arabinofuranosidase
MRTSVVVRPIVALAMLGTLLAAACSESAAPSGAGGSGATMAGAGTSGSGGQSGSGGLSSAGGSAGVAGSAGATSSGAGGTAGTSGSAGTAGSGGSGGQVNNAEGPCDIYESAGTPCVAAYSTVRRLASAYAGPLYEVRKGGTIPNTGTGGQTQDIGVLANGFADAAAQDAFCGSEACTVSKLYDQSGQGNDLTVAKKGCYGCSQPMETCSSCTDTACEDDYESDAKGRALTVGGNNVYALFMDVHEGYRSGGSSGWPGTAPPGNGMPTGQDPQGIYMVAEGSGKRPDAAYACCWNFGNVSTNNCYGPSGQMNALFLGKAFWGKGADPGPWFMGDFEAGVWAGGTEGNINDGGFETNANLPPMTMDYAFGILKTEPDNYAIRVADATTGDLTTAYDGPTPGAFANGQWSMQGNVALGLGGDNSNHASGTFLEGAITAGRPSDETDALIHANVTAIGYGQ